MQLSGVAVAAVSDLGSALTPDMAREAVSGVRDGTRAFWTGSGCDAGAVLGAEVAQVRLGVDRPAGDALERLPGCELPAERVEVVAQPGAELAEIACFDLCVHVREPLHELLPDLQRDHV